MANNLPKIREDIELSSTGEGQWTLYDKASGKYFRLNELSFIILSYFHRAVDKEDLLALIPSELECTMEDIDEIIEFCARNFLIRVHDSENLEKLIAANAHRNSTRWYTKLIHSYLFFKIHLFNPDKFLEKTVKATNIFYTNSFQTIITLLFIIDLIFIFNRFSEFASTLTNFASLEGVVYVAISIIIVKLFHEFGHAYTAKRSGCRVPSMGIAFMVFYPMPYTDTSDAWKLSRKMRMQIALAGIKTEMIIAVFTMMAWLWLAEGSLKSLAFFLISVSMVSTLAINLTPFMRYDGYYALSDYLGIENLHTRAFSQAKAFVKKVLWNIDISVESFTPKIKIFLILFAFTTWIYRVILFSGIAYLVYSHTFKALGIILFWIEIWYFVLLPIVREIIEWYKLRSRMSFSFYSVVGWITVLSLGFLLFIPYSTVVRLPAVIDSNVTTLVYAEYDSQIIYLHPEGKIKKGDLILSAHSIGNDLDRQTAQRKLQLFQKQSATAFVSDETLRDSGKYLQSLRGESVKINVADSIRDNMNIYALDDGILLYEEKLTTGEFIGATQKIATIINPENVALKAYIKDVDLAEIHVGAKGNFFDRITLNNINVSVVKIENTPIDALKEPLLNSNYKGSISVAKDNIPQRSLYEVKLTTDNKNNSLYYQHFGEVAITLTHSSLFERLMNETIAFFISESDF